MKYLKKYVLAIILFAGITNQAQSILSPETDYFKEFRKNEQPTNSTFQNLISNMSGNKGNFYVVYKST